MSQETNAGVKSQRPDVDLLFNPQTDRATPLVARFAPRKEALPSSLPWMPTNIFETITSGLEHVTPVIHALVEKGFFRSEREHWTAYRVNPLMVECSFGFTGDKASADNRLRLERDSKSIPVRGTGMRLSAVTEDQGSEVRLKQQIRKRDKGTKSKIQVIEQVFPTEASSSKMSTYPTRAQGGGNTANALTFNGVQFSYPTENAGRRNSLQQYIRLVIELYVDVRSSDEDPPVWIKVAQRPSERLESQSRVTKF